MRHPVVPGSCEHSLVVEALADSVLAFVSMQHRDQNFLTSSCENSLSKKLKDIFMKYSWLCPSIATAKHIAGLLSGLNLFEKIEILLAWLNSVLIPPLFGCMHYCFLSTIFVLCTQLANAGNRNEQQKKAARVKINILSSWRLYFMFVKIMEY